VAAQRSTPSEGGQTRTQFLGRYDTEGVELARYREASMTLNFGAPDLVERELLPAFLLATAVGPDGRVYVARDRDSYAVEVYAPDGELERVITREFTNWRRDDRDNARMSALFDAWMQGFPGEVKRTLDEYEPPISELFVDDDGVLWVQHCRSGRDQPDGVLLTYDTFDPDGRYLREVSFAAAGDAAYDGIKFLGDDRALVIKGYVLARWVSRGAQNATFGEEEETGPMEIIYCRMEQ